MAWLPVVHDHAPALMSSTPMTTVLFAPVIVREKLYVLVDGGVGVEVAPKCFTPDHSCTQAIAFVTLPLRVITGFVAPELRDRTPHISSTTELPTDADVGCV